MAQSAQVEAHSGPTTKEYLRVGIVLAILTAAEVLILVVPFLKALVEPVLVWLLVILSIWKFVVVILTFMHLKFDSKVYSGFFYVGVGLAVIITAALVVMFAARGPNTSIAAAAWQLFT